MASKKKDAEDKRMTLKEAIKKFVHDGCTLGLGGMASYIAFQVSYEIIRQKKKDLIIIAPAPTADVDMLIGAGLVKKFEGAYLGGGLFGYAPNFRRSIEEGYPNRIEIEEYTNYTMGLRYLAGSMGIPFMPTKSLLGSDIPKYNKRIKIIEDPYTGEPIALVPAANPEVAIIHVHRADKFGNSQILGILVNQAEIARAAEHTIITCEEIISTEEIRRFPNLTAIPFYCVDAVVEVPYCCHPLNMPYYYINDIIFESNYYRQSRSKEGFLKWLEEWCYSCEDWRDYCKKIGWERLWELTRLERLFNRFEGAPL